MQKIDFSKSGSLLKEIIKGKVIEKEGLSLRNGGVYITKAYKMNSGRIKVYWYQYSEEFSGVTMIDLYNKD